MQWKLCDVYWLFEQEKCRARHDFVHLELIESNSISFIFKNKKKVSFANLSKGAVTFTIAHFNRNLQVPRVSSKGWKVPHADFAHVQVDQANLPDQSCSVWKCFGTPLTMNPFLPAKFHWNINLKRCFHINEKGLIVNTKQGSQKSLSNQKQQNRPKELKSDALFYK